MSRQHSGQLAEQRACQFLQRQGLRLLERNWRCRLGELDLIMRDDDHLVFVEVRYRSHAAWGGALESVDARKQARLIRAAEQFLQQHPALARLACRFDVVALDGEQPPDWLQGAFTG